jgi:hypothetical protein
MFACSVNATPPLATGMSRSMINGKTVYIFKGPDGENRIFRFVVGVDQVPPPQLIQQILPQIKADIDSGKFAPRNIITVRLDTTPAVTGSALRQSSVTTLPPSPMVRSLANNDASPSQVNTATPQGARTWNVFGDTFVQLDGNIVHLLKRDVERRVSEPICAYTYSLIRTDTASCWSHRRERTRRTTRTGGTLGHWTGHASTRCRLAAFGNCTATTSAASIADNSIMH